MSEGTGTSLACPACGTPGDARFCGHCGALVRARTPAPAEVAPTVAEDASETTADPPTAATASSTRPSRRGLGALAGLVLLVAVVAVQLRAPAPGSVTLGTDAWLGAGGTGVTSDRGVTDLTARWRADSSLRGGLGGPLVWIAPVSDLGDTALLRVDGDLVHVDLRSGAVRWRLPRLAAVPGTGPDELLLLSGDELSRLDPLSGRLSERVQLGDPVREDHLGLALDDDVVVSMSPVGGYDRRTGERLWHADGWLHERSGHLGVVRHERPRVVDLRDGRTVRELPAEGSGPWQETFLLDDLVVVLEPHLRAYDLATGDLRWEADALPEDALVGHLAISDGVVVVELLDASGSERSWHAYDGEGRRVELPPGIAGSARMLRHVDGAWVHLTGAELVVQRGTDVLWQRTLEVQQLTVGGGVVIAGVPDRTLVLDVRTGEELTAFRPLPLVGAGGRPVILGDCVLTVDLSAQAVGLAEGQACWERDVRPRPRPDRVLAGDGVAVLESGRLRGIEPDGTERWIVEKPSTRHLQPLTERWHALLAEAIHDPRRSGPHHVTLLDTRNGATDRTLRLEGTPWRWVGRGDVVAVQSLTRDGAERSIELWELPTDDRPEPRRRWTVSDGTAAMPVTLDADTVVAAGSTVLTELGLDDGELRRRVPLEVRVSDQRALHPEVLVGLVTRDRLVGLDRATGALRWELALPGDGAGAPSVAGDVAYLVVGPRRVLAVDVHGGEVVGSVQLEDEVTGVPVAARGRLLVPTRGGLVAFGEELSSPPARPAR